MLFILMDYPILIQYVELSILPVKIYISLLFLCLKIVFIVVNNADPDEMLPYVAFHQGLHCLPKYLFTGIKNEKG